jgi:rhamnulokinase
MNATADFLAVDLGASSGRVLAVSLDGARLSLSQLHRFSNHGIRVHESLYWDVPELWEQIQIGLGCYATRTGRTPMSIGIDSWGVDYALIGSNGEMLANPHHYRDARTQGIPDRLYERMPESALFTKTGIQCLPINSLFQLYSMVLAQDPLLTQARSLLPIPDLFNYFLTGEVGTEPTIASTTQMLSVDGNEWCNSMLAALQIPTEILPALIATGTRLPDVRRQIRQRAGILKPFPVVAIASHDTASAVAAIPELGSQSAFLSSGTWSLIGVERDTPVLIDEARELGFSNERSATGRYLLLKNVTGLWLLQECRRRWTACGRHYEWDELVAAAEKVERLRCLIDPNAPEFVAPADMPKAIQQYCARTSQWVPQSDAEIVRCCIESLAAEYRSVIASLQRLTGVRVCDIRMVGGGTQNRLLCQLTADACQLPLMSGPEEASALGNAITQAVAVGAIQDFATAQAAIAASFERTAYHPNADTGWAEAEDTLTRIRLQ